MKEHNRQFPSCLSPVSKRVLVRSLSYRNLFYSHAHFGSFTCERLCTKTRFETEAESNLEITYRKSNSAKFENSETHSKSGYFRNLKIKRQCMRARLRLAGSYTEILLTHHTIFITRSQRKDCMTRTV